MRRKVMMSAGVAAMGAMLSAPMAAAQEEEAELRQDAVIVTDTYLANEKFSGMKTQTPIIDVPQSLSVVDADKIREQAFTNMGDILRYTPGASIGQGEGHRDQITLRGQNTTADFFLDGLRDDVQYFRPLYNIDQVEILRGSNAMIFGRGGGGGVVNRASKRPNFDSDFTGVTAGVNTFGEMSGAIDYNKSISDNSAVRVNAFAESLDNHRDHFEGDRFAINPTFATKLTSATDLLLSYEYVDDDRVVDRGVPSENGKPVVDFTKTFFGSPDDNRTTLQANIAKARLNHKISENMSANFTAQYADYEKLYQNLYSSNIDTAAGRVELDGYKDTTERQNLILQGNLVSEFSTGGLKHTLLIGAEYADQSTYNARNNVEFGPAGIAAAGTDFTTLTTSGRAVYDDGSLDQVWFDLRSPLAIPAFGFTDPARNRDSDVQTLSVYVQDQVDLGGNFKLVGGLRFDQFEIDTHNLLNDERLSRTDEEVSPRIGLIYKPAENVSAYVSYSKSFLPESGDQFLSLSSSTAELEPEEFENREIGLKWDFKPDLSMTIAYFELDRDTSLATPDAENRFLAVTETKGFEIQINGYLNDRWAVDLGFSNLESEIVGGSLDGNETGQVPANMLSIWNRFEATDKLGFGLGVVHQGEQYVRSDNSVRVPDFVRIDAAAFYEMDDGTILQANIENLMDEEYFPDAHSNTNISTGAPVNVRFTFSKRF